MDAHHIEKLAVDLKTAAAMVSVWLRTLENYIVGKGLPARKIGHRTVIRVRGLEAFLRRDQPSLVLRTDTPSPLAVRNGE